MKKVLSLSVLLLSLSAEFAVAGFRMRGQTRPSAPRETNATPASNATPESKDTPASSKSLTSASALAAAGVTLDDVAAALQDMGANASNSKNKAAAKAFITTGSASMPSSNKSHKLGRLGSKK